MNDEYNNPPLNDDHLTAWESFFNPLVGEYRKLLIWVKPDPQKNTFLEWIKLIYKLPILILISLFTPVALIFLVIAFVATF